MGNSPETWFQRVHPEDRDELTRDIDTARAEGPCDFDLRYRMRHKDGTYRWMSSRGLVVRNDAGEAIRLTGSQTDVTVETVTDPLTGLPNRLLLVERLTQSIERAYRSSTFYFALLLLDVGRPVGAGSKPGPTAGDPLLNAAARRLETCLRIADMMPDLRQNDLVARVHDDRLAVLLDGVTDLHHAKVVADRILVEMLQPLTLSNREARLSPTIGIAVSATGYTHADDVLRDAETALHRAQVLGGSHCEIFDADVLKSEQAELQLENDFELALERREFALVYQPIVSIAARRVVGFEVLVRWHHPVLGVIAPIDFIPIAERTGFIVPLGHWILHEACVRLSAWQTSLPLANDLWMSVNLSGVQVRHPALVDEIDGILRSADLQPRSLVLELTEGIAMDNPTAVATLLMRLRATGIRISIDDFGTGYSSLAYLHQFPVDALKIDRSFIRRMAIDKDTAAIVGSTIDMAQRLGLHVVAEGVENENQLDLLRALQCESAQGYLFAEPLDADSAADLLQTGLVPLQKHPARDAMAASPGREGRRQRWQRRRLPAAGRWLLVGATVLGILTTAGVVALFKGRHPVQRSSTVPVENASQTPPDGTLARSGNEAGVAPSLTQREAPVPTDTRGTPVVATTSSTAVPRPAPARKAFDLVHLHRIGNCRGRLLVSREGVAFVPKDRRGGDAVALKHTDFVHSVNGDTLTIRSATKTYRFTAAAGSAKDDNEVQLSEVVQTIVRARSR